MAPPRIKPVLIVAFLLLWVLWSLFVVVVLVPVLARHLNIHPAIMAWILCALPLAGVALAWALRLQKA